MTHTEEQKLLQDMATLIERIENLPCRKNDLCVGLKPQHKIILGTGFLSGVAAIITAISLYIMRK